MTRTITEYQFAPPRIGLTLLAILFLPASFFFQPNLGGEGLSISHNITVWIAATLMISAAMLLLLKQQKIFLPRNWLLLAALPVSLIVLGFVVESFLPLQWLTRQLYILGGFLFLLSLFQFQFKPRHIDTALLIILIAGICHALYGISQMIWPEALRYIRTPSSGTPYGIFQQINLHASFQATTLLIGCFLISRPVTLKQGILFKLIITSSIFLSSYIIAHSGSRVGLLGAAAGIILIVICRWPQLRKRTGLSILTLILIIAAVATGSQGIMRSADKFDALATVNSEGIAVSGSASRVNIYTVAIDVFKQSPITGHGIGSFQKVWLEQKADFLEQHPKAIFPAERLSHPHNEFMFWLVEGGVVAILGILCTALAIVTAALNCGWRRGITYLALLLPIGLHTQVELPFYISNIHWFLLIFLLFMITRHRQKVSAVNLSRAATVTTATSSLILSVVVTGLMIQAVQANNGIIRFLQGKMTKPSLLQPALSSPFFSETAEMYLMRTLLLRQIVAGHGHSAPDFILWAEPFIEYTPVPQLYIDLARAYLAEDNKAKAIEVIERGQRFYPALPALKDAAVRIRNARKVDLTEPTSSAAPAPQPGTPSQ